jgi:Uncharacterized protein encoded in hypervariable junctions of pilus gene clusters
MKMKEEEHEFWVVESTELNGCAAQADTLDEALKEFEIVEQEWLETAAEFNVPIPEQRIEELNLYSGKLSLRLPKTMHKQIAKEAEKDGVSINNYICLTLAEKIGKKSLPQRIAGFKFKPRYSWQSSVADPSEVIVDYIEGYASREKAYDVFDTRGKVYRNYEGLIFAEGGDGDV